MITDIVITIKDIDYLLDIGRFRTNNKVALNLVHLTSHDKHVSININAPIVDTWKDTIILVKSYGINKGMLGAIVESKVVEYHKKLGCYDVCKIVHPYLLAMIEELPKHEI